jgi:hypothetical protein
MRKGDCFFFSFFNPRMEISGSSLPELLENVIAKKKRPPVFHPRRSLFPATLAPAV